MNGGSLDSFNRRLFSSEEGSAPVCVLYVRRGSLKFEAEAEVESGNLCLHLRPSVCVPLPLSVCPSVCLSAPVFVCLLISVSIMSFFLRTTF